MAEAKKTKHTVNYRVKPMVIERRQPSELLDLKPRGIEVVMSCWGTTFTSYRMLIYLDELTGWIEPVFDFIM